MKRTRIAIVLAAAAAALIVAAPAGAAPLNTTVPKLLNAERGAKARKGMGLPSYAQILGRKWKRKVRKADARIVGKLAPTAKTAALTPDDPDPLKASDVLKHGAERQKRTFRIATALNSMCPVFSPDPAMSTSITAMGRAEQVIATVERVRGYDITTIVTIDLQIQATAGVSEYATVSDPSLDWGTISLVRQQTARNRKTGKVKSTGPAQRLNGSIGPLWDIEADWEDFINRNGDGDESPAPRRPLRSDVWETVAQKFVVVLYSAFQQDFQRAEAHFRTPNTCVTLDVPHPERLAPSQVVDLTGKLRLKDGSNPPRLLPNTRIAGYLVNDQGQDAASPAKYPLDPGEVWYRFTAAPKKWPESRPIGMDIEVTSESGVATARVLFKPTDGFPVRYKVLSASFDNAASGSADSILCGTQSGTREFSGGGTVTGASSEPEVHATNFGDVDGNVYAKIPAQWHNVTTKGCKWDEATHHLVPCEYSGPNTTPLPDGRTTIGFSVHAPTATANETATLTWAIPDPEIGYIDAGDEECNTSFMQHLSLDNMKTKVPLSKLLSYDPQTYTINGVRHWGTTALGAPASIDYSWSYTVTLQRIP